MHAQPTAQASTPRALRPAPLGNGLVYVNPGMPGFSRVRRGERFRYRDTRGGWITDADEIRRIDALAIPPAYREVWICPLANGHLQAIGLDARGRRQYRYHPDWRSARDEAKFERLVAFGRALPRIRARVARDLAQTGQGAPARAAVLAAVVRLLDTTYLRVGNEAYAASNGSFGLTTLRNPHAKVAGSTLRLRFRGKSGVVHTAQVDDPRVARVVRRCLQLPGQELFQYAADDAQGDDALRTVSSTDVNDYLREAGACADGESFTAKDFRTWHGTVLALELTRLACGRGDTEAATPASATATTKDILAAVAAQLGNTPAVCKKAYVHPAVLALGAQGAASPRDTNRIWDRLAGRGGVASRLHAAEARLLAFLQWQARAARPRAHVRQPLAASGRRTSSARSSVTS